MDSKLKSLAIICAVLMILTVLGTVLLINIKNILKAGDAAKEDVQVASGGGIYGEEDSPEYYSYLNDETFFDRELSDYEKLAIGNDKRLSLMATSIQRDVRVQIVDESGKPVKGQDLFITLNDVQYKDLDKDGIVYVGDLSPGDYEVALLETEGFKVPSAPITITVRENVEFYPIEDIAILLKTEDDIDANVEDSEEAVSGEDMDETEDRDVRQTEGSRTFGIDVSKWNGDIDWQRVRNSGVEFVIIRCGYRGSTTGALIEDPRFRQNLTGARAAGLKVGLYFFTQAVNEVEAVEEASAALSLLGGAPLEYPIFIDVEGAGGRGRADRLGAGQRTLVARAFCETVENSGYRAGVYASRSWMYNNLDMAELDSYIAWLAEYRESPLYTGKYHMWQYTDKGRIDGIETNVDFNLSFGGF